MDNNIDDFFQGKIKLFQPSYKATSDAVLLGAAVQTKRGTILDVGTGNGAIAIISAFNNAMAKVTGIDINPVEIENAKKNAKINELDIDFMVADINENPLKNDSFDIVVSNPPYFKNSTESASNTKKLAHHESNISLEDWVYFCVRRAKFQGYIYIIIDISRVPEVIKVMSKKCGGITLFPLFSKEEEPPKRVIIRARKETKEPFSLAKGMVLHNADGSYTDAANKILRDGDFLKI